MSIICLVLLVGLYGRPRLSFPQNKPTPAKSPSSVGAGDLDGRVINAQTGAPVEHAHVQLISIAQGTDDVIVYGAMSKHLGLFSIKSVRPGSYYLVISKPGFVFVPTRDKQGLMNNAVSIRGGQRISNLEFRLARRAIISGHVLNQYGEPMAGVSVRLMPIKGDTITENGYTNTDDRGIFRISTAPGNYYLQASPNSSVSGDQRIQEIVNEGEAEPTYSETFYPEASSKDDASALELVAGRELPDVDVRLIHSEPHKITGVISGAPSNSAGLSVTLASQNESSSTGLSQQEHGETKFQLGPIAPGTYQVYAQCVVGNHELRSQVVEVKLADADVDLNLVLARGSDVTGKVEIVGLPPAAGISLSGNVTLQSYAFVGAMPLTAPVGRDRSFQIRDVHPAKYLVTIAPLPENGFVERVAVNGTTVPDNIIDLSAGVEGATVVITINANGASISGKVQGPDSHSPVPAYVVLKREGTDTPDAWRPSVVGADGAYAFKALPPGKYKLLAVDIGTSMAGGDEFLKKYESVATDIVELKEGDRLSKDIKLLVAREP